MKTLQINELKARALYPTASAEIKEIFVQTFGSAIFTQKITDRVKTLEDALLILDGKVSTNVATLMAYNGVDNAMIAARAAASLSIIAEALNEGWKPDWTNSSQGKYYPWFKMSSGSGLSFRGYDSYFSGSGVGSRLCFKSKELAEYAGKQFISIYQDFMCI